MVDVVFSIKCGIVTSPASTVNFFFALSKSFRLPSMTKSLGIIELEDDSSSPESNIFQPLLKSFYSLFASICSNRQREFSIICRTVNLDILLLGYYSERFCAEFKSKIAPMLSLEKNHNLTALLLKMFHLCLLPDSNL